MEAGLVIPGRMERMVWRSVFRPCGNDLRVFRPRANQAHFPLQNIPQLRNFIKLGIPQPAPNWCDARVIFCSYPRSILTIRAIDHRTEFQDVKILAMQANPWSTIEHRIQDMYA